MDSDPANEQSDEHMAEAGPEDDVSTIVDDASTVGSPVVGQVANGQVLNTDSGPDDDWIEKNQELMQSDPVSVQIRLGDQETIPARRALLCHYSGHFARCFEDASGVETQLIEVSDANAELFRSLVHWMYYHEIRCFDDRVFDLPGLVHLWVMADAYEVSSLCNKVIDLVYPQVHVVAFKPSIARLIWKLTRTESKLRQLLVKACAQNSRLYLFRAKDMPWEFCEGLVRELYELRDKGAGGDDGSTKVNNGLDLCAFHEHPDRVDCRGARTYNVSHL